MRHARVRNLLLLTLLATACIPLAGCYERVVGAKGLGSDRIETQEPYQQDTELDRWIYGGPEAKPK